MEVRDVLADEVVDFAIVGAPPIVELLAGASAPLLSRCHVTDRSIEPDIPIVARAIWNFESEVGRGARNIPIAERLAEKVSFQIVGNLGLQMVTGLRPVF